jgi:hypothetical protein
VPAQRFFAVFRVRDAVVRDDDDRRAEDERDADFREPVDACEPDVLRVPDDFRDVADLRLPFGGGTLPPASRASDRPIAIACLRLVTLRPEPLFSVPRFLSRIARSTFSLAFFPYLAISTSGRDAIKPGTNSPAFAAPPLRRASRGF